MKIHLTKKEYKILLEMLYIAEWIVNSHNTEDKETEHYKLVQNLYSYYKDFDVVDAIHYTKADNMYCETKTFEDELMEKYIDPYDEENLWEALVSLLAERDVMQKVGGRESYITLDNKHRFELLREAEEFYIEEFHHHGITRLGIKLNDVDKH